MASNAAPISPPSFMAPWKASIPVAIASANASGFAAAASAISGGIGGIGIGNIIFFLLIVL
jgi:hypothetical protein